MAITLGTNIGASIPGTFNASAFAGLADVDSWQDAGPSRDEPPVDVLTRLASDQNTHMSLRWGKRE